MGSFVTSTPAKMAAVSEIPGKALGEELRGEVVEVEVDVVLLRADAAPLADLHRHRARDDVARREVLRGGRVALHEALALAVAQDAALAARPR